MSQQIALEEHALLRGIISRALFAVLIAIPGIASADDPSSIEQFNAQSSNWQRLAGTGKRLALEGRCTGMSQVERRLLMTRCELIFEIADDVVIPREKPPNVEVVGHLQQRGSRVVFVVTSLQSRLSDLEKLRMDRRRIDFNRPDDWYALAQWARTRAEFYEDELLDEEATELYRQGIQAEFRRLPAEDAAGLVALAAKTRRFGLSDRLRMEFLHEAVSREFEAASEGDRPGFDVVVSHALEWLPGARIPLLDFDDEARRQQSDYLASRGEIYEEAEDPERRILERMLYLQATLEKIEGDAAEDGRNGFAIAERIEASLPEFDELPEEYRQLEIRWRIENVTDASREELLILVARLEERDQESQSIDVRRTWLEARAVRLNRVGISGKLELAEEYLELLGDEEAAVSIYRELYQSAESQTIAANRLQELGYTFDGEEWRSGPLPDHTDELAEAIRNGSVRAGMSEADVRAVLGRPESTVRFASRGEIVELWVYPDPGISIHFSRKRADEEQIAVEVFNLPVHTRERLRH